GVATTEPTTAPATQASTEPAKPPAKWQITSEPSGPADETAVDGLLSQLSPLHVEKYVETSATTQPSDQYTLTIVTSAGAQTINIADRGGSKPPVGEFQGLRFELSRFFLDKLTNKFDGTGAPANPRDAMPQMPANMNFMPQ